jgi:hypothetical protein
MATIGRAFGFYLKYWQEMQAHYEDKTPLGPSSKKDTEEMIRKVGERACEQAAEFLTKCGAVIEEYFSDTVECQARVRSRPTYIKKYWEIDVRLGRRGSRKTATLLWTTGASIDKSHNDTDPALFLYIWVRGSRGQGSAQVEEDLDKLLGEQRIKYQAAELGWYKGTAIFGKIPLSKRVNAKTFEIDEEKLLDEVSDFLKTIGKKDAVKLFEI